MPEYVVTHVWHTLEGEPYVHTVPGTVPHVDIAFYVADLLHDYTALPTAVYLVDVENAGLIRQDRPEFPTMDPADIPRLRIEPSNVDGAPPDILVDTTGEGITPGEPGDPAEESDSDPGNPL